MQSRASAVWRGGLKDGKGTLNTQSGVIREASYTFGTRFEGQAGTNPEELVAAAHAGCFAMYLGGVLEKMGRPATSIEASATVSIEKMPQGWTVSRSHLEVSADVPGIDEAAFDEATNDAKANCPISRVLVDVPISMDARLNRKVA